jgi:dihydroorotase
MITNLIATEKMTWSDLVRVMAHGPRAALGIEPVQLVAGGVADITIIDPEARVEIDADFFTSRSRNSAFLGSALLGKASEVLVEGQFALRNGKVVA